MRHLMQSPTRLFSCLFYCSGFSQRGRFKGPGCPKQTRLRQNQSPSSPGACFDAGLPGEARASKTARNQHPDQRNRTNVLRVLHHCVGPGSEAPPEGASPRPLKGDRKIFLVKARLMPHTLCLSFCLCIYHFICTRSGVSGLSVGANPAVPQKSHRNLEGSLWMSGSGNAIEICFLSGALEPFPPALE